jgi:hypothetical protein
MWESWCCKFRFGGLKIGFDSSVVGSPYVFLLMMSSCLDGLCFALLGDFCVLVSVSISASMLAVNISSRRRTCRCADILFGVVGGFVLLSALIGHLGWLTKTFLRFFFFRVFSSSFAWCCFVWVFAFV